MANKIMQLLITLEGTEPKVWRRIYVPADYSCAQLHMAIQGAFGWTNCHLFQFSENSYMNTTYIGIPYNEAAIDGIKILDARRKFVRNILKKKGSSYYYIYDFGDHWLHKLVLESTIAKSIYAPYCIEGENACPPEDVGGIGGYVEMVQAYRDGDNKEIIDYDLWLGLVEGETWRADFCSIREVNQRLALLGTPF